MPVDDNDVLELNVSGEIINVKRKILCQVKNTILEIMFSSKDVPERDNQKRPYLELNPVCFRALVDALRYSSLHPMSKAWRHLEVPREHHWGLLAMMYYLDFVRDLNVRLMLDPNLAYDTSLPPGIITVDLNRTIRIGTKHEIKDGIKIMACDHLPGHLCEWEVSLHYTPGKNDATFLGVAHPPKGEKRLDAERTWYDNKCAYGWASACWIAGDYVETKGWDGFKGGDFVRMALDHDQLTLTMTVRRGPKVVVQSMPLPLEKCWYIVCDLDPLQNTPASLQIVACRWWV